ncbi:MAG TPA: DJ-1/PfpI family protein [Candidatus Sulfotelmatobacter sp.]|nr:DJ-1/PfpI family protein [Candidatus Sulfotelmatobacter sp.]
MRVVFLIGESVELFDLAGPVQVFHEANALGAGYEIVFAGTARSVASEQGVALAELQRLPRAARGDLIVVPGSRLLREAGRRGTPDQPALVAWVKAAHAAGATIASVCVGAFLLARAGLLDGRECTTHWKHVDELQRRFPKARVLSDRLYVQDGPIVSSAGIASGVDMALALVEAHAGPRVAATVAREMVVHVRRPGADAQLNSFLDRRDHLDAAVHLVQDRIVNHPAERHTLDELAEIARLSRRHLSRTFRAATGMTVGQYHMRIRLEHARTLLPNRRLTIEEVAQRCGLEDARHLRRAWKAAFGTSPGEGRR